MDLEEARELLQRTRQDRVEAERALQAAQATIESCGLIMQGVVRRFPELGGEDTELAVMGSTEPVERARGSEAVLQILEVDEEKWFSIRELVQMLDAANLLPESANPPNAVRTAVERLFATEGSNVEKRRRHGTVEYRLHMPVWGDKPAPDDHDDEEPFDPSVEYDYIGGPL